jgi:hypothetical protein
MRSLLQNVKPTTRNIGEVHNLVTQLQSYISQRSNRREKLVQVKGQRIEFLASCVCPEIPEPIPPMHASISLDLAVFMVQCHVQEQSQ